MSESVSALSYEGSFKNFNQCVICGIRLYSSSKARCDWCQDPSLHQIIHEILQATKEYLIENEPTSPSDEPVLRFISDIGELSAKHPYISSLSKIITLLIERGVVKRENSAEKIWGVNLLLNAKRILPLMQEINLITYEIIGEANIEINIPSDSILKRAHYWIQTEPNSNDAASFILGYIILGALNETIEAVEEDGELGFHEGVARIFPLAYGDDGIPKGLRMPKGIISIIAFIIGSWVKGWNEFDEFTLHKFLQLRGVTGKEFSKTIGILSQTVPGISHSILEYETYSQGGIPIKRFNYSKYVRELREYLRTRMVERER